MKQRTTFNTANEKTRKLAIMWLSGRLSSHELGKLTNAKANNAQYKIANLVRQMFTDGYLVEVSTPKP